VLQPRTRGFVACLAELRGSLDAVYDLTIGYKNRCPLFINNLYGTDPAEVHMHIRRIPLSDIPESEEDMSRWLYEVFYKKDQMLASFSQEGSFPNSGNIEKPLNIAEGLCTLIVFLVSSLWVFWWLISSFWLRIYVVFICLVLAFGTYFDWRPSPFFYTRLWTKRKRV
jgi:lysocardiolipin and lysophospholipid acyltransferase